MNVLNVYYYYDHLYLYYTKYTIIISISCLYNHAYSFVNYMSYANLVYNTEQKTYQKCNDSQRNTCVLSCTNENSFYLLYLWKWRKISWSLFLLVLTGTGNLVSTSADERISFIWTFCTLLSKGSLKNTTEKYNNSFTCRLKFSNKCTLKNPNWIQIHLYIIHKIVILLLNFNIF